MDIPPDTLNRVGVLTRREIEARIVAPLVDALGAEFGRERVIEIVRATIARVAEEQGAALAQQMGGDSLLHLADSMEAWTRDDALRIEVHERSESRLSFDVTRCRYAEMYRALGIPELGAALSCNRDGALICGFNPRARLRRTQTIMEGASHCDFRYEKPAFDAVIFDMDGLMFDTESIYCETSMRASAELGFPFDESFYKANFVGKRLVDSEKFLRSYFGPAYPIDEYRERSGRYLRESFAAGVPVKPGLHELLDWPASLRPTSSCWRPAASVRRRSAAWCSKTPRPASAPGTPPARMWCGCPTCSRRRSPGWRRWRFACARRCMT